MRSREKAVVTAGERDRASGERPKSPSPSLSSIFGSHVFSRSVMEKMLPKQVCDNVSRAMKGLEKIRPEYADSIAVAMKEWAMSHGATHYTHWFQPLTGSAAEKHDSFMDCDSPDEAIEKFSGKQLLQGEPDASSFPSGGLRTTFEARGYTGWDPSSPAFIWTAGDGVTLFIPSVFYSWRGEVLDTKIPLHRSIHKIERSVLRLAKFLGVSFKHVYPTVGMEQEYFVIDRALRNLRPDLLLANRTVFGAPSPKGQELQDHYFGAVKDRILRFMRDFELGATRLGIPLKTRHNEVAPAQHEVAPIYEPATIAVDHNLILMELMRQTAVRHDLACLLHEKPFQGLNGSGKHTNWSLATDTGLNLLDPSSYHENSLLFLTLLTAILSAVHKHAALLRASVGSLANDFRLGGHEAPPAIISVYLGEELEQLLTQIEKGNNKAAPKAKGKVDLGIPVIPELPRDNTDRNRTSPFCFTGNKFEFRAVGSSASSAMPLTVLHSIVAESLDGMLDEMERGLAGKGVPLHRLVEHVMPVLRRHLKSSKAIRFHGDNYTQEWEDEARRRKIPVIKRSLEAFQAYKTRNTYKVFEGVLGKVELDSRYDILVDQYAHGLNIEANLMLDLFRAHILPAAMAYQEKVANAILSRRAVCGSSEGHSQEKLLKELTLTLDGAIDAGQALEKARDAAKALEGDKRARAYCDKVGPAGEKLRTFVDQLETMVDDTLWPLPKYRELLFMV